VVQGHIRHARAHVGEANNQDNCDVMSFAHGGPDMGCKYTSNHYESIKRRNVV
jgi:hypothetical protein